VGKVAGA